MSKADNEAAQLNSPVGYIPRNRVKADFSLSALAG